MTTNLEMAMTIRQAKNILDKVIARGDTSVRVFLHSSPGIGKSSLVKQVSNKYKLPVIDLRLSTIEATDLCGIPYVYQGEQKFSVPDWFPLDPNSKGIIFLDELSNASIEKQQAAYRLVLDREIQNNRKLPDGWFVIAAGNLKTDQTGAKAVVPALANRFSTHLTIKPNLDDFTAYAVDHKLNQKVVGFLNFSPSSLYQAPTPNSMGFPSPRSWEQVSNLMSFGFEDDEFINVIGGCVGFAKTIEFLAYLKYYEKLPDFQEILNGSKYTVPMNDMGLLFAVTTSVMYLMMENHQNVPKIRNLSHILEQLSDEFLILVYKTIAQTKNVEMILNVVKATNDSYDRIKHYIK